MCTRYSALRSNAAKTRRGGEAPGLEFGLSEFASWFAAQPRCCAYCAIPEHLVAHLGLRTQVGLPLQRLGVDRTEEGSYRLDAVVLCCFACNKARSNTFTADEMHVIGEAVSRTWSARLAAVGIVWERPGPL